MTGMFGRQDCARGGDRDVPCFETLIIGNQTRPLGLDVYTSSNNTIFMESALVYGESDVDSRRLGVLSRGYSDDESINWQFGIFERPNLESTGMYVNDSLELTVHARVSAMPWVDDCSNGQRYLHIGATTAFANANDDAQRQTRPELRTQSRWIDTGEIAMWLIF
jgi:phosphate-selective porin OprO and OprP